MYKRQAITHVCNDTEHLNERGSNKQLQPFTAVSYTHLDVYKRQSVENKKCFTVLNHKRKDSKGLQIHNYKSV